MFKKFIALILSFLFAGLMLTGCSSSDNKPKNPNDENILVYDKELDNGVQLQVYRIAEGTINKKQSEVLVNNKEGDKIIAARYVLTNKTDKPIDVRNVTIWNANFKNSPKGVGTFNYSDISLHADLGYTTLPAEFEFSNQEKWMLEPGKSAQFAYDWVIDSNDLIMTHYIVFAGDKNIYQAEVNLTKP